MVNLFIIEEQGLMRGICENHFSQDPQFSLAGTSSDTSVEGLTRVANSVRPDVLLIGTKILRGAVVDAVRRFQTTLPNMACVLLASSYDLLSAQGVLDLLQRRPPGFAFLLKDTVDSVEDLARVVQVAASGHLVVDPGIMEDLIGSLNTYSGFFKALSNSDVEVLDLMAKGYSDRAIAAELRMTMPIVKQQIDAIYDKTGARAGQSRDPRVHTITTYLKAAGTLPVRDFRSPSSHPEADYAEPAGSLRNGNTGVEESEEAS